MTDDRPKRISRIFEQARMLPTEQRAPFLDGACQDDVDLRREVESLLKLRPETSATGSVDLAMVEPDPAVRADRAPDEHDRLVGQKVGSYHIKKRLAAGGMGTVYIAQQESPRRTVALKVMKRGITSKSALRRFEYESQILGRLRHPNVAQVFEAGTHDDGSGGVPFFAMEYIPNAKPITNYARDAQLTTKERLLLFAKVCDAIHHGHQKGIIHRDLKPGNILVDSSGEPKVIDFGVARSTDSDMAVTTLQTDVGQLIGTVQYMSPEQFDADPHDLDTRSDVYALGVILYELLCEQLPYDVSLAAVYEAGRIVKEEAPAKPSTLNRTLRGDVETITLKAMEKERGRRYRSAEALGDDIRRYLRSEPVLASPPSVMYRTRKFVRRHRVGVTAGVLVAASLVAGGLGTSIALVWALQAERSTRTEAHKATAMNEFLNGMFTSVDPALARGREVTVRELLASASAEIAGAFPEEPEVEAMLRHTFATMYYKIGDYDRAVSQLHSALNTLRRVAGEDDEATLRASGTLALLQHEQGLIKEGEELARSVLAAQQARFGEDRVETMNTMHNLAFMLRNRGELAEAEDLYERLVSLRRRIQGDGHPETLRSAGVHASVLIWQARYAEAEPLTLWTMETARRELGSDHPVTALSLMGRGWLLHSTGRLEEAEALYREAYDTFRRVLGDLHPTTLVSANYLAWMLKVRGHLEEAESIARIALDGLTRLGGESHPKTLEVMNTLAVILGDRAKWQEAEKLYRTAFEIRLRDLGEDHVETIDSMNNLGVFHWRIGELDEAEGLFRRALALREVRFGPEHPETLKTMNNVALVLRGQGELDEARRAFENIAEIRTRKLGAEHQDTLSAMENLAAVIVAQGDDEGAVEILRSVYERRGRKLGANHPSTLENAAALGHALCRLGQAEEAETLLRRAIESGRSSTSVNEESVAQWRSLLGACLTTTGRCVEAEQELLEARETLDRVWQGNRSQFLPTLKRLARLYETWGRPDQAAEWRAKVPGGIDGEAVVAEPTGGADEQ